MKDSLYAALFGRMPANPSKPEGRILLTVRCKCGTTLCTVHATANSPQVFMRGQKFPKSQTARMILDQALRDLEYFLENGDHDAAAQVSNFIENATPENLATVLPGISTPNTIGDLSELTHTVGSEIEKASSEGRYVRELSDTPQCGKCGNSHSLGKILFDWNASDDKTKKTLVISESVSKFRKVRHIYFPDTAIAKRANLYAKLYAVLS